MTRQQRFDQLIWELNRANRMADEVAYEKALMALAHYVWEHSRLITVRSGPR